MTRATVYRHMIDYGEDLHWAPPTGAVVFYVWLKFTVDNAAMRWWRVAGWDVANDLALILPDTPADAGISLTGAEVALDWAALVAVFDGFDAQILQITTLDADRRAFTRDVFSLPPPTTSNINTIVGQERQLLKELLEMRLGLAAMHGGHVKVRTPDGSEVERMPIAVIDRRISEVRARIRWFEMAAQGVAMPGLALW